MKKFLEFLLVCFFRTAFWFRYRVKIKGLEKLNRTTLNKPGGILFLPNHPTTFVDPTLVTIFLWPKFSLRHMVTDYMYYMPLINTGMRFINALPVPNFEKTTTSLKMKKTEEILQVVIEDLKQGKNFLIYPAGRVKHTGLESIQGVSGVHRIVTETPEANIVLVRTKGLWGSSFSCALTGEVPGFFNTLKQGIKNVFKNLLFFTPRRDVCIEFEVAPADFPLKTSRLEFNRYLENWYNKPDGLSPQQMSSPGETLVLVPYSMWSKELPVVRRENLLQNAEINLASIPIEIKQKVENKLAEMKGCNPTEIRPFFSLWSDLALDSMDIAELVVFLEDQFDVVGVPAHELTTVEKLMAIAAKQIIFEDHNKEEESGSLQKWNKPIRSFRVQIADGETIPAVFLNNCARQGHAIACTDSLVGEFTYFQLKVKALILANYIRRLPGEYIGILLPASVTATVVILACQLANKIPLLVNWTVGPRHLDSIVKSSNVKAVLTSWSFLDRLENVDLKGVEDLLLMLEDIRHEFGLLDKLNGYMLARRSPRRILNKLNLQRNSPNNTAVLLFTSGTENAPKGVLLTHQNILSNQRACLSTIPVFSDDVVYGILPPFHSFGFTISTLVGILAGVRIAFSPNPTDGKQLIKGFKKWGVTIVCGAPLFIKSLLKAATTETLKTMRICITGSEKAPPELFQMMDNFEKSDCLIEGYGITECSPVLTLNRYKEPRKGVGKPLPGVELLIIHLTTNEPLEIGQQGLILTRGPNIFSGYLNLKLSNSFMRINNKDWYVTGDLGYLDQEGNLTISGRLKRFVKVGAEMVSLASIESVLSSIAIKNGWTDPDDGYAVAICAKEIVGEKPKICLYSKFTLTVDEANKFLKESGFSNLVKISSVIKLPEIPLLGSGKINYSALDQMIH